MIRSRCAKSRGDSPRGPHADALCPASGAVSQYAAAADAGRARSDHRQPASADFYDAHPAVRQDAIEYPNAAHTLEFEPDPQTYFADLAGGQRAWLMRISSAIRGCTSMLWCWSARRRLATGRGDAAGDDRAEQAQERSGRATASGMHRRLRRRRAARVAMAASSGIATASRLNPAEVRRDGSELAARRVAEARGISPHARVQHSQHDELDAAQRIRQRDQTRQAERGDEMRRDVAARRYGSKIAISKRKQEAAGKPAERREDRGPARQPQRFAPRCFHFADWQRLGTGECPPATPHGHNGRTRTSRCRTDRRSRCSRSPA